MVTPIEFKMDMNESKIAKEQKSGWIILLLFSPSRFDEEGKDR